MTAETGKNRKREEAIAALLVHPTIAGAAKAIGISEPTLLRWLKDDAFTKEYRTARRQCVEGAIALMQKAAGMAVGVLVDLMRTPTNPGSVRATAARTVLEYSLRGQELLDLEERLAAIEASQEQDKSK